MYILLWHCYGRVMINSIGTMQHLSLKIILIKLTNTVLFSAFSNCHAPLSLLLTISKSEIHTWIANNDLDDLPLLFKLTHFLYRIPVNRNMTDHSMSSYTYSSPTQIQQPLPWNSVIVVFSFSVRSEDIVIFALGIGGYKIEELNAAANDPDCTHMFLLQSFNEIDSILYQIRRSACTGKYIILIHHFVNVSQN